LNVDTYRPEHFIPMQKVLFQHGLTDEILNSCNHNALTNIWKNVSKNKEKTTALIKNQNSLFSQESEDNNTNLFEINDETKVRVNRVLSDEDSEVTL